MGRMWRAGTFDGVTAYGTFARLYNEDTCLFRTMWYHHVRRDVTSDLQECAQLAQGFDQSV